MSRIKRYNENTQKWEYADVAVPSVRDVQINGASIVTDGVASIPITTDNTKVGLAKGHTTYGTQSLSDGSIVPISASNPVIDGHSNDYRYITPKNMDYAVTASLTDGKAPSWTPEQQTAAQERIGVTEELEKLMPKSQLMDAGIKSIEYEQMFGGEFTATTAIEEGYIKPHARASATGRISKYYSYLVTVNGIDYVLPCDLYFENIEGTYKVYEYLGNLRLYMEDVSGVTHEIRDAPFLIVSDLDNASSIDVFTNNVGTFNINVKKILKDADKLPNILIYGNEYGPFEFKENSGTFQGFSLGVNALKNSRATFAIGYANECLNEGAIAIGSGNIASGSASYAEGSRTTASGNISHSEGYFTEALGYASHAECGYSKAVGNYSHSEGRTTEAKGNYSHAEGLATKATSAEAHSEGWATEASGNASHAEGHASKATALDAHAEGEYTIASADGAHAEGGYDGTVGQADFIPTVASSYYAHAEGGGTTASGITAHSEGHVTVASGRSSHAEGRGTKASSEYQHAEGKYNIEDTDKKYLHIAGNGASDTARSNAHTLDWQGNAWYQGKIESASGVLKLGNTEVSEEQLKSLPSLSTITQSAYEALENKSGIYFVVGD